MAKDIQVHAAKPIGDQKIHLVRITIQGYFSESLKQEDVDQLRQRFKLDAEKIFDGLRLLPGGTFDQLLILMLQKQASSFIVPHDFHDGGEGEAKSD